MKKSFLSTIIAICLLVMCASVPAAAASVFPDVLSPDHDWAASQIEEMTELGIIKGYSDGTFKPDNSISKIEALLLFARVAGVQNPSYESVVEAAYKRYQNALEDIDLGIYDSLADNDTFLIDRGIITEKMAEEYLADNAYNDEFPRAEAAVLLTNLCGAEPLSSSTKLNYADSKEIDKNKVGYIAYVSENKLMSGVQKDDGTIAFDADKPMTRAQVCVLLYKIMEKVNISVEAGSVIKTDTENKVIEFTNLDLDERSYIIPAEAKITVNNAKASLEDIIKGSKIVITRKDKEITNIDTYSPTSNATVSGTVLEADSKKTYDKLVIKDEESGEKQTYYITGDVEYTSDGVSDKFSSFKKDDFVVIKLLGTDVVAIDRQTTNATVQGEVEKISLKDPIELTVTTIDETTRKETSAVYTVGDDVTVRRDGEASSLRSIVQGDKVILTITRGNITKIVATGSKSTASGTITTITIASQSSIKIIDKSVEKEYPIALDATYQVAGKEASIYDLRLGTVVTLTLSGTTVTKIEQSTEDTSTTKSGVVQSLSTTYGYLNIMSTGSQGGYDEQIFASKSASAINSKVINGDTGASMLFKNIKQGDYIIAIGSYSNGAFIAKTIIVTPAEK